MPTSGSPGGLYGRSFYEAQRPGSASSARIIVPLVLELVRPLSVIDVGCGAGTWLAEFAAAGCAVTGIDGGHLPPDLALISAENYRRVDILEVLSDGQDDLLGRYDLTLCLEVAEHLPPSVGEKLVSFLCGLSPAVLFSAAVPGQGGTGHINERWQDYWRALFADRAFDAFDVVRPVFWHDDRVEPWYKQNVLLMISSSAPAELRERASRSVDDAPRIWSVVHPRQLELAHGYYAGEQWLADMPQRAILRAVAMHAHALARRTGRYLRRRLKGVAGQDQGGTES